MLTELVRVRNLVLLADTNHPRLELVDDQLQEIVAIERDQAEIINQRINLWIKENKINATPTSIPD